MARNTKVGSMYVGVGMDTRDFERKQKQLKSGTKGMSKDFKKLNDDISNLPFFGRFVDDFKRMAASIKSVVGVAKGASVAGKVSGGISTKPTGGVKTGTAIAALQAAEIAREKIADDKDYALQERQNALIGEASALSKARDVQLEKLEATLRDAADKQQKASEEANRLSDLQVRVLQDTKTEKRTNQSTSRVDRNLERLAAKVKYLEETLADTGEAAVMMTEKRREKLEGELSAVSEKLRLEREYARALAGVIRQQDDEYRSRGFLSRVIGQQGHVLHRANKELEEASAEYDKLSDSIKKQQDEENKARIERERIEDQERQDATATGKALKFLRDNASKLGDMFGKIGDDVVRGTDDAANGKGKEGGSITGKVLTGLGIAGLAKRFPKLAKYMMQFAAFAAKSRVALVAIGAVIATTIVVGLTAAVVAMAKFVKMGNKAAEDFDRLAKQSELLGVNVNQLNRLRQQGIQLAGMEAKAVDTAVQRFTRRLSDGTLDKKLKEMGFTLREISNLKMQNSADALEEVRMKFSQISSEGERLRLAFAMFDTEGAKFALALANQGASIDEINAKMERYGLIVTANQQRALVAVKRTNEELEMQAAGTSTQVGAAAAGVAESWNKLWLNIKEATRFQDLFNWVAVKGMKAFEIGIDLVRVALIPVTVIMKSVWALVDGVSGAMERLFGPSEKFLGILDKTFATMRRVSKVLWGTLDPLIDLTESVAEMFGYETAITEELGNQDALRQKLAADRAKELDDMEAKKKAAERELAVLQKGEKAVRNQELSQEYRNTLSSGQAEGESNADWNKRRTEAKKLFMAARAEYNKNYDAQMAAEKKLADFKEKRAREIAEIEEAHTKNVALLEKSAADERASAEEEGSNRLGIVSSLYGSQSFSAGQGFDSGSSEEYSYLRDLRMAEQRRNEEKEARKQMQDTLNSIDNHLEDSLRLEQEYYNATASEYSNNNFGVKVSTFNGVDPS